MKALTVVPGTKRVQLVERPEPSISAPDEVKLRVLQFGVCGTDREEVAGGRALAPQSQPDLVIGHEMFGQVMAIGSAVTRVRPLSALRHESLGYVPHGRVSRARYLGTGRFSSRVRRG